MQAVSGHHGIGGERGPMRFSAHGAVAVFCMGDLAGHGVAHRAAKAASAEHVRGVPSRCLDALASG